MPFRNAAVWVKETIDSILNQSYSEWELICINDHSQDNTEDIIAAFGDTRIRVIQNQDPGIIPALQLGLKHAKGDYITRMDADDIMPTDRLEIMINIQKNATPKTIVTGKVKYFSNNKVSKGYRKYENWLNDRIVNNDHWDHIYRECVVASPNWLARKQDILNSKIFKNLQYPEDYDMAFHWMVNGFKIKPTENTTLYWREHPNRTSRNSDVYDQDSFFNLKLNWFTELNNLESNEVAIFGAGKKGKIVAKHLSDNDATYSIYDINHVKYLDDVLDPNKATEPLALVCIYPKDLNKLECSLQELGYEIGKNAWYV